MEGLQAMLTPSFLTTIKEFFQREEIGKDFDKSVYESPTTYILRVMLCGVVLPAFSLAFILILARIVCLIFYGV